jgi:hypothetical protein
MVDKVSLIMMAGKAFLAVMADKASSSLRVIAEAFLIVISNEASLALRVTDDGISPSPIAMVEEAFPVPRVMVDEASLPPLKSLRESYAYILRC